MYRKTTGGLGMFFFSTAVHRELAVSIVGMFVFFCAPYGCAPFVCANQETSIPAKTPSASADQTADASSKKSDEVDANWWYFRGDKQARAYLRQNSLPEKLDVVWEFESPKSAFEGSPVSDGKYMVAADLDGRIWCLDATTGKKKWSLETKTSFIASPSLHQEMIFLGDSDGIFHCYSMKDGEEKWKFESNSQIDSAANFFEDNVIFGSEDASLYCLDQKTGEQKWVHATDDQIRCSIVVAGGLTYVAGCDGRLHIVDLKTGTGNGEVPLDSVTGSTPANLGNRVYFGLEDGQFLCVDVIEKKVVWEWRDEKQDAAIRGSASITDKVAVFGTRGNQVICLDLETGKEVWKKSVDRKVDGSPVIVGSRIYIGDGAGKLLVMQLESGEIQQEIELSGSILGSPCVIGQHLIVATDEGMVYCLGKK